MKRNNTKGTGNNLLLVNQSNIRTTESDDDILKLKEFAKNGYKDDTQSK